jgi:hypothetical protein
MGDYTSLVIGAVCGGVVFALTVWHMSKRPRKTEPPTYVTDKQAELFKRSDEHTLQAR